MNVTKYLSVFVMTFVLSATHFALAEPVKVYKQDATQKSGKTQNQSHHSDVASRKEHVAYQKAGGVGQTGLGSSKRTSRIDGTELHRRR